MLNLTPMVRNLILANVLVFFVSMLFLDLNSLFALRYIHSPEFQPYQFLTYMFAHGGGMHLFFNMFGLFMFGPLLEQHWGSARFLVFYLICGLGAGFLYSAITYYEMYDLQRAAEAYLENPTPTGFAIFLKEHLPRAFSEARDNILAFKNDPNNPQMIAQTKLIVRQVWEAKLSVPMVGASGALFGVLMAFGLLFPNLELFLLFLPIPIKAKYFVLLYGAYELYAGIIKVPGDNVAHFAHLGGMLFAYILIRYWQHQDYE